MSKNINTNTAVAQIILSKDHEIRIKKKPKKRKSSGKKKEALAKVKSALQNFDLAVNAAKNANVSLPENLGKLPSNINEINSVKELNALALDLQNRINQINQLVQQGNSQSRTQNLFREAPRPQMPGFLPEIIQPRQPEIIPSQPIPSQVPVKPSQPQPTKQDQQVDNDAEKTLDELQQEILDKLSPEDRKKAEAQIKKNQQQPILPDSPDIPSTPTTPTASLNPLYAANLFETDKNFLLVSGQKIDLKSPIGFTDIYRKYRIYIEGISSKLMKIDKGIFVLPKEDENELNKTRQDISSQYENWTQNLNTDQNLFLDEDPTMNAITKDMLSELELSPEDIIRKIAKGQKIQIKQITSDMSNLEKERVAIGLTDLEKEFLNKIKLAKSQMDQIIMTQQQIKAKSMIDTTIRNMNDISANIDTQYNSLSGKDKVGILSKYQAFQVDIKNLIEGLNKMKSNSSTVLQPDTYEGLVDVDEKEENINKLLNYYNNPLSNWKQELLKAYIELFGPEETSKITKKQGRNHKRKLIKQLLKSKYNVLDERFDARPKSESAVEIQQLAEPVKPFIIPKSPVKKYNPSAGLPTGETFDIIIQNYINDPKSSYNRQVQDAIIQLLGREQALKIQDLKSEDDKKDFIRKDFAKKQKVMEQFSF